MTESPSADRPRRLLDFRSGGWLILASVVVSAIVAAGILAPALLNPGRAVGDGNDVDSYGFDLSTHLVPLEGITAAGIPRDGIPSLRNPPTMTLGELPEFDERNLGRYLVSADRVVGVVINGEARAYPVRLLNWHEIVNDTVAGVPIAVTYHPFSDTVAVFDRRTEGVTHEFRVSGLVHNCNLLMYDHSDDAGHSPSLWSQLLSRAVAGPAAVRRDTLLLLPSSLARWGHWKSRYPDTTLPTPEPQRYPRYRSDPYGNYIRTGPPRFPVSPMPPDDSFPPMSPIQVTFEGGNPRLRQTTATEWPPTSGLDVDSSNSPVSIIVPADSTAPTLYTLWFAWYSHAHL